MDNFNIELDKKQITALISADNSSSTILQMIAGLKTPDKRLSISYPQSVTEKDGKAVPGPRSIQYVPDDIICYSNLTVEQFLRGVLRQTSALTEETVRLLTLFDIDASESLLDMTFEKNRLVSIIQALIANPEVLLLDRPYDMLSSDVYKKVLMEINEFYNNGTIIVISAASFSDIVLHCSEYIFLDDEGVKKCVSGNELPVPAKVVTMWDGDLSVMEADKLQVLFKEETCCRFLYREPDAQKLADCLKKSNCTNFHVDELSMEEEIFGDYERWMS